MTRRRAAITQADVGRAARAARALGPEWYVEIETGTGTIRVMQAPPDRPSPAHDHECEVEPQFARGLAIPP